MRPTKAFVLLEMMNAMLLVAQEAKQRGFAVVVLNRDPLRDNGPFAVPDGVVDELVAVGSWEDADGVGAVLDDVLRRYEVVGTYAGFEATLPFEAELRERAGLPNNGADNVRWVLDKARVREQLRADGLSALKSVSLAEALEWEAWGFDGPAVLKPTHGTGSALCFVVSSLDELRAAAEKADQADVVNPLMKDYILGHREFVLEEQAQGELLSVESVVSRGQVHVLGLMGRYLLAGDPVVELGQFFPYEHPRLAEIAAKCTAIHHSLGVVHGATHVEMMVGDDGSIELIDFNARFAGCASAVLFGEAFRQPFPPVLTDIACGLEPDLGFLQRAPRYAVEQAVLPPPGVRRLHDVRFPPESVVPRLMKSVGQELTGRADQLDTVGMFIVSADTPAAAHRTAIAARRATEVNGRPLGENPTNVVTCAQFVDGEPQPAGTILIIGGRLQAIQKAKRLGLRVVFLQHPERLQPGQAEAADAMILVDYLDWEIARPMVEAAHQAYGFTKVVTLVDQALELAGRINDLLGLGGTSQEVTHRFRDKLAMREWLHECGFESVAAREVRSADELREFGERHGYPFVLKPVDAAGSRGVVCIDEPAEIDEVWRRSVQLRDRDDLVLAKFNPIDRFFAEEYIDGVEYSVESFSFDGRHIVVAVTDKLSDGVVEMGHAEPAALAPDDEEVLVQHIVDFLAVMGLTDGVGCTEIKMSSKGPRIIEGHDRVAGDRVMDLVQAVYGVDLEQYAVGWPLRQVPALTGRPPAQGGAATRFLSAEPGVVTAVEGAEEAGSYPGVIDVDVTVQVGDVVGAIADNFDRPGQVIAAAADAAAAVALCESLVDKIHIRTSAGR